jgi:hypothetical protein
VDPKRAYVDSSVLLRTLFREASLGSLSRWDLIAGELLPVESLRTIQGLHAAGLFSDAELRSLVVEFRA